MYFNLCMEKRKKKSMNNCVTKQKLVQCNTVGDPMWVTDPMLKTL